MPESAAEAPSASSETLRIALRPSRLLAGYLIAVHGLAGAALFLADLSGWIRLLISATVAFGLVYSLRRHYWRGQKELIYREGSWKLLDDRGAQDLELAGESYIHPWLCILRFKTCVLTLLPDSADSIQLSALRRTLRYGLPSAASLSRR